MRQEWRHGDNSPNTLYRVEWKSWHAFGLEVKGDTRHISDLEAAGGSSCQVDQKGKTRRLYQITKWMAEVGPGDSPVRLTLMGRRESKGLLHLSFRDEVEELEIRLLGKPGESRKCRHVSDLWFVPGAVIAETADESIPMPAPPAAEPARDPGAASRIRALEGELQGLRADLARQEKARLDAERELSETRGRLEECRVQLENCQARLEETAACGLEELTGRLDAQRENLSEQLREKLRKAEDAERELIRLREELSAAESAEELRTLDIQKTEEDLEELRGQLESNEDILALMREEPFFKGKTIGKMIDEAHGALDGIERRLGQVIRLREAINRNVQSAILQGDGTVPLERELGGAEYDGGGVPAQDTGSGSPPAGAGGPAGSAAPGADLPE